MHGGLGDRSFWRIPLRFQRPRQHNLIGSPSELATLTRNIPMGYGNVLGDWREDAWWTCDGQTELRVYVSTEEMDYSMYSLMQDPEYRTSVGCMTMGCF